MADAHLVGARTSSNASPITTAPGDTTSGSTFLILASWGLGTISDVRDNKGNEYQASPIIVASSNDHRKALWVCPNGIGGEDHTATIEFTGGDFYGTIYLIEVTGVAADSIDFIDGDIDNTHPYALPFGPFAQADTIIVSIVGNRSSGTVPYSSPTADLIDEEQDAVNWWTSAVFKQIVASTDAINLQFQTTNANGPQAAMVAIALKASSGEPNAPTVTDVDTDEVITADQLNVIASGTDFDAATVEIRQGSVALEQSIDSQNGTAVQFDVVFDPGAPGNGPHLKYGSATFAIINQDEQESTFAITIDPPSGVDYIDLSTPNSTAENRITAVDDLSSGDQLEISNVQGGTIDDVTVNADATFECSEGVTAFDVRAWDASDASWGAKGTQTVVDPLIEGGLSKTLDALSGSGSGTVEIAGDADAELGELAGAAEGSVGISGSSDAELEELTQEAEGSVDITGAAEATLDDASLDASGSTADGNTGSLEETLDSLSAEASGSVTISGTGAAQLDELGSEAEGSVAIAGSGEATLDDATLDASGASEDDDNAGALDQTLDDLSAEGAGTVEVSGGGAVQLGELASDAEGSVAITGSAEVTLNDLQSSSTQPTIYDITHIEFGRLRSRSIAFKFRGGSR